MLLPRILEDLKRTQENGCALFGLMKALTPQDKLDQAAEVETRFKAAYGFFAAKTASS